MNPKDSNQNKDEDGTNFKSDEGPCEADIEKSRVDALMKLSITNGKVRKIVGTVLAIQSWPYNVRKEPPAPAPFGPPSPASDVGHTQ